MPINRPNLGSLPPLSLLLAIVPLVAMAAITVLTSIVLIMEAGTRAAVEVVVADVAVEATANMVVEDVVDKDGSAVVVAMDIFVKAID